jgi:zinc transporter ZupT
MGFAAGVMIYVSFMEIFPHALNALDNLSTEQGKEGHSYRYIGIIAFFAGMLLVALIDKIVPHDDNPHEFMTAEEKIAAEAEMEKGRAEAATIRAKVEAENALSPEVMEFKMRLANGGVWNLSDLRISSN